MPVTVRHGLLRADIGQLWPAGDLHSRGLEIVGICWNGDGMWTLK